MKIIYVLIACTDRVYIESLNFIHKINDYDSYRDWTDSWSWKEFYPEENTVA